MASLIDEARAKELRRRRIILLLVFLGIIVALVYLFRAVLTPFLVALFAAYLIDPVVERMAPLRLFKRFTLGRAGAIVVIYVVLIVGIYLSAIFALPALDQQMRQARRDLPALKEFVEARAQEVGEWWTAYLNERREEAADEAARKAAEGAEETLPIPISNEGDRVLDGFVVAVANGQVVVRRGNAFVLMTPEEVAAAGHVRGSRARSRFHLKGDSDPHIAGLIVGRSEEEIVLRFGERFVTVKTADVDWEEPLERGELDFDIVAWLRRNVSLFTRHLDSALNLAVRFVFALLGTLYMIVLIMMITAFIVIDRPSIVRFVRSVPPDQHQETYSRLLQYFDRGLAGVIRGQLTICLVNGILTWIGLELLGVRYALLLGLVAGIFSIIPIFGTILSTVPIVLIAWGTGNITTGLLALGWILLIHFLEANFLNPKIMGTASKIHPVVVIFALLAGEHAYGIVGALLAVPAASLIQSAFKFYVLDRGTEGVPIVPTQAQVEP